MVYLKHAFIFKRLMHFWTKNYVWQKEYIKIVFMSSLFGGIKKRGSNKSGKQVGNTLKGEF